MLDTKVRLPVLRHPCVPRREVLRRLGAGLRDNHLLTLISAPAGYGKTTTVRLWLEEVNIPAAWVRLESTDNELAQFLKYVLTALLRSVDGLGRSALELVETAQEVNVPRLLGLLIDDLTTLERPVILVLDDYHLIENPQIDGFIESLLRQSVLNLHLVITTREDPNLPLAHMRVRDQLTEIRAADLRFSKEEARDFFTNVIPVRLQEKQVDFLEQRTEGWAAGLQLAALSLKDSRDPETFISAFRGTHRHVLDYLLEEVLNGQPEEVRSFLRRTSILNQLSASLCDAVTGQRNSRQLLQYLDRSNLFLVPLDDDRTWFRYHALFAELLKNQLLQIEQDRLDDLLTRAAGWYEQNGFINQAVEHAFQASDHSLMLRLLGTYTFQMLFQGEVTTVAAWFDRLADSDLRASPMLCINKAWSLALMQRGTRREEVDRALQQAERALDNAGSDDPLRGLVAGHTASIQAFLMQTSALASESPYKLIEISQKAQRLLPPDEQAIRAANWLNIAYGYMALADVASARAAFTQTLEQGLAGGNLYAAIYGPIGLIMIASLEGQIADALKLCDTHIRRFQNLLAGARFPPIGALYIQKGSLLLEQNRVDEAQQALLQGLDLVRWTGEYEAHMQGYTALARVCAVRGDLSGMLGSLQALEETWPEGALYAQALRHRLALQYLSHANRDVVGALTWLAQSGIAFDSLPDITGVDPLSETHLQTYLCVGHILARMEQRIPTPGWLPVIHNCLARQQEFAEAHGLVRWWVELAVARSLLYQAVGEVDQARVMLQAGLNPALQKGFFRIFVNEGRPMLALLTGVRAHLPAGPLASYTGRLIDALNREFEPGIAAPAVPALAGIELSDRELAVLRGLASGLTYPGLAEQLIISVNTVRYHVKGLYNKLGVSSRAEAIALARAKNLL